MAEFTQAAASLKPTLSESDVIRIAGRSNTLPKEMELRTRSLEQYLSAPIPDRITHLWRYSDPALFFPRPDALFANPDAVVDSDLTGVTPSGDVMEQGVEIRPLSLSQAGLSRIGEAVPFDFGLFEALNGALWTQGIYIRVPRGIVLESTIQIVHRAVLGGEISRVVVDVEQGAVADVVEVFEGGDADTRAISVSELFVGRGAALTHAVVQGWEPKTRGHVTVRANVERDGLFRETSSALGGAYYKADLGANLIGIGAQSEIVGVSFSDKKQQMDFHTVQHHAAEQTRSNIHFKAALSGKSISAYTGLIRIAPFAKGSEAFQSNRNLMLSDKARAHAIPELEILNNDVQCSHAAVSSPIDDNELFYLMSRGLSPASARTLLLEGFFEDALQKIPLSLREAAKDAVIGRASSAFRKEVG